MGRVSRPSQAQHKVATPHLFTSPEHKRMLEDRNVIAQFDEVCALVEAGKRDGNLSLSSDILLKLQGLAIRDIYTCAGQFRATPIYIDGSLHQPPEASQVRWLVQEMCDTANKHTEWSPVRTSAYLMWRLNWIHPFSGGNGRTSRACAYYGLCERLGMNLPGVDLIPEQIRGNKSHYYDALDVADAAWKQEQLDLSRMESLLTTLLARQLLSHPAAEDNADYVNAIMDSATTSPL